MRPGDIRRRRQLEIRPIRAVLPACDDDTFYAHIDASAYCGDGSSGGNKGLQIRPISAKELEIQPIRAVLPACNGRHSIKGTAPSFLDIPFNDAVQKGRRFVSERSVERNENTSVTSGGSDSNAISPECNPGTFDGGDSSRFDQSQRSSRHATTKTATTTRSTRTCDARRQLEIQPIRAVLPACNAQCRKDVESW